MTRHPPRRRAQRAIKTAILHHPQPAQIYGKRKPSRRDILAIKFLLGRLVEFGEIPFLSWPDFLKIFVKTQPTSWPLKSGEKTDPDTP